MKKLFLSLLLLVGIAASVNAGIISSNLVGGGSGVAATNLVWLGPARVYQVDITSATANTVRLFDANSNSLTIFVPAYTASSNITMNITNLVTNAIYEFATVTNYQIQTNIYIGANFRTNYAVIAASNAIPPSASISVAAGGTASLVDVDLNFVRGIYATATNSAVITVYTRP